jgi:hypothetical protein
MVNVAEAACVPLLADTVNALAVCIEASKPTERAAIPNLIVCFIVMLTFTPRFGFKLFCEMMDSYKRAITE